MSFLARIFGGRQEREAYRGLYDRLVNAGRDPAWYVDGEVPDSLDGRFDMIAAVFALVLIRLEADEERTRRASVLLAELFIDDMEGSIRQLGIGDLVVGKQVGRMMGALGGRLSAFRAEIEGGGDFSRPVIRNVFRDSPPSEAAVAFVSSRLRAFYEALAATPVDDLLAGRLPEL